MSHSKSLNVSKKGGMFEDMSKMGGIVGFFGSLLSPGINNTMIIVMYVIFAVLFLSLFLFFLLGIGNIHIYIMLFLAMGLFLSLNFVLIEYHKAKKLEEEASKKAKPNKKISKKRKNN